MRALLLLTFLMLVIVLSGLPANIQAQQPTRTLRPTRTPLPTRTPRPTRTPNQRELTLTATAAFYSQYEPLNPSDLSANPETFIGRRVVIQGRVTFIVDDFTFVIAPQNYKLRIFVTTDNVPKAVRRGETVTIYGTVSGRWQYTRDARLTNARVNRGRVQLTVPTPQVVVTSAPCPNRRARCTEMTCEQAYACLIEGNNRLDSDQDGVPCEAVCSGG